MNNAGGRLIRFFEIKGRKLLEYRELFNSRQQKLIEAIEKGGEISKRECEAFYPVSRTILQNDLRDLVELGVLRRERKGKHGYYRLSDVAQRT